MKYICVIFLMYSIATVTGQRKPKESEDIHKWYWASSTENDTIPPLKQNETESWHPPSRPPPPPKKFWPQAPFKSGKPQLKPTTQNEIPAPKPETTTRPPPTTTKIPPKTNRPDPNTNKPPLTSTLKSPTLAEPNNPCAPFLAPPMPDFRAPGRRISEVKCFEYIWQLKVRSDVAGKQNKCDKWKKKGMAATFILGGHFTAFGDYPNMGAIGWKAIIGTWKFMCGCTLISSKYVLTAAHCSSASERDTTIADIVPKIVRLGAKNILDDNNGTPTNDVEIVSIIIHPNYKAPKQYYDIALMELGKELKFNMDLQPACLWTKQNTSIYGYEAQVTGWGVVESGSQTTSHELLAATVDVIDSAKCDKLLRLSCNRNWCGLQNHQLCAGKLGGGVDACQGDSGGPLQVKIPLPVRNQGSMHYVIGVTSFGVGCALPGLPGVYTRVSSFVDWIEGIVWPDQNDMTTK